MVVGIGVLGGGIWLLSVYDSAPSLASLQPITKGAVSKVYAADGSLIGVIHSDTIRQPVASDKIPQDLKDATVAIEDQQLLRATAASTPRRSSAPAVEDLDAGGKRCRAARRSPSSSSATSTSTIRRTRSKRKIIEANLANEYEDEHSKDWILDQYLNTAPYGTNDGATAIGVEAAVADLLLQARQAT